MFDEVATRYSSVEVDRRWRLDLIDAYAYMRIVDRRGFQSKESVLNGLLNRYPLTEDGYIALAANMFWNNWPSLTSMFMRINNFLTSIASDEHDPAILTHWAGVRFLLDSQRARTSGELAASTVDWPISLAQKRLARARLPAGGADRGWKRSRLHARTRDADTPHRISEQCQVIEQIDILDILAYDGRQVTGKRLPGASTSRWKSSSAAKSRICSSATPMSC
jgi:hypothetical protein